MLGIADVSFLDLVAPEKLLESGSESVPLFHYLPLYLLGLDQDMSALSPTPSGRKGARGSSLAHTKGVEGTVAERQRPEVNQT